MFGVFIVGVSILAVYTGNLLLDGEVLPGKTFEGEFLVNDIKDMTFIFSATESIYLTEQLKITIIEPNGNSSSSMMMFRITPKGEQRTTFTTKPKTTGKYHINITEAKFPTYLKIKLGMINIKSSFVWSWVIGWIIVLFGISKYLGGSGFVLSKEESLIAMLLSIVITSFAIYYFST